MHFPVKPDHLGVMAPIPAVATIPGSSGPSAQNLTAMLEEVAQRQAEFLADLQPRGVVATILTRRAALLSVRLERSARHEAATVALRVRRAEHEFVANRLAEVDHLHSWIHAEPATYARRLRQSPEGIDRLLESWRGLRSEITDPDFPRWDADHQMLALSLTGHRAADLPVSPLRLYSEAYIGHPSALVNGTPELARLKPAERQELARLKLVAIIDAEAASLTRDRAAIDLDAIERDRLEAADRALFDPSPAATLARRYDLATERGLFRALRMVAELEAAQADEAEIEPDDVIEAAPDPTLAKPAVDRSIGQRSRQAVAFMKSARRAAEARATMPDPASPLDTKGRPRRPKV